MIGEKEKKVFRLRKENPESKQFYNRRTKKYHLMKFSRERGRFFCVDTQPGPFPGVKDVGRYSPEPETRPNYGDTALNENVETESAGNDDSDIAEVSGGGIFGGLF